MREPFCNGKASVTLRLNVCQSLRLGANDQNLVSTSCHSLGILSDESADLSVALTFRHRASSIQDRRFATLQRSLFIH